MDKIQIRFVLLCIILTFLVSGCTNQTTSTTGNEEYMNNCWVLNDFDSIVIGQSNAQDVNNIAPVEYLHLTSYGGYCEYPMQDGKVIHIDFYGPDLVVGKIMVTQKTGDGLREP